MADAVISLERTFFEEKRFRILRIEKLRGAEVRNPRLCFTIHKGTRVLPPAELMMPREPLSPRAGQAGSTARPARSLHNRHTRPREIGGLQDGSVTLLELSPKFTVRSVYNLILAPLVVSHVKKESLSDSSTWRGILERCKRGALEVWDFERRTETFDKGRGG